VFDHLVGELAGELIERVDEPLDRLDEPSPLSGFAENRVLRADDVDAATAFPYSSPR
jgi:hypothetical protein